MTKEHCYMIHILGQIIIGLFIGIIAKVLLPGYDGGGLILTALLGMAGAWVGAWLGQQLGWYKSGQTASFLMSIAGAMVLLLVFRLV